MYNCRKGGLHISKVFRNYVLSLALRLVLLTAALCLYFTNSGLLGFSAMPRWDIGGGFLFAVWVVLAVGMVFRIVPNFRVTIGARKHYACSYSAAAMGKNGLFDDSGARKRLHKGALVSAVAWVVFNAALFTIQHLHGRLTQAAAVVLMLFYAVCDIVCILFFCPFRVFIMRNRCCAVCRIHNWDYIMICTPLILFPSVFSFSLLALSIAVLLRWEIALRKNPHFFIEETNENLRCERCDERLCMVRGGRAVGGNDK